MTTRIAVVGAGAVGAVYARHLIRGGAHVTFVVRPNYVDDVKRGIRLWRGDRDELLMAHDVVGDIAELAEVDQVWLCVPSTGLDDAALTKLASATNDALVVDLTPDLEQRALRVLGRDRLVDGLIPFLAWQTPLELGDATAHIEAGTHERDERAPGIAWWTPPLMGTALSGPRAANAAAALRAGGMRARVVEDAEAQRALVSALMMPVIATLELSGWSLHACRRRLDRAAAEALRAMARKRGVTRGPLALAASPFFLSCGLAVANAIAPLPLERYLRLHFTKVAAQTRLMMRGLLEVADATGVDAPRLRLLTHELAMAPLKRLGDASPARGVKPRPDATRSP